MIRALTLASLLLATTAHAQVYTPGASYIGTKQVIIPGGGSASGGGTVSYQPRAVHFDYAQSAMFFTGQPSTTTSAGSKHVTVSGWRRVRPTNQFVSNYSNGFHSADMWTGRVSGSTSERFGGENIVQDNQTATTENIRFNFSTKDARGSGTDGYSCLIQLYPDTNVGEWEFIVMSLDGGDTTNTAFNQNAAAYIIPNNTAPAQSQEVGSGGCATGNVAAGSFAAMTDNTAGWSLMGQDANGNGTADMADVYVDYNTSIVCNNQGKYYVNNVAINCPNGVADKNTIPTALLNKFIDTNGLPVRPGGHGNIFGSLPDFFFSASTSAATFVNQGQVSNAFTTTADATNAPGVALWDAPSNPGAAPSVAYIKTILSDKNASPYPPTAPPLANSYPDFKAVIGDMYIVGLMVSDNTLNHADTITPPSGYTALASQLGTAANYTNSYSNTAVYAKIVTSNAELPVFPTQTGGNYTAYFVILVKNVQGTVATAVDASAVESANSGGNPVSTTNYTAPPVTAASSALDDLLIRAYFTSGNGTTLLKVPAGENRYQTLPNLTITWANQASATAARSTAVGNTAGTGVGYSILVRHP